MQAEPAERVAWPLVPAGPGRESRRGLSLSGVTEPKRFARSLGWQPGPAPVCPGKAFLLVSSSLLLAARFSPGTGARRCPGAVTLVATRPQHSPAAPLSRPLIASLSVPEGSRVFHSLFSQQISTVSYRAAGPLRSGLPSACGTAVRHAEGHAPFQSPCSVPFGCLPHHTLSFQLRTFTHRYGPFYINVTRLGKQFFFLHDSLGTMSLGMWHCLSCATINRI